MRLSRASLLCIAGALAACAAPQTTQPPVAAVPALPAVPPPPFTCRPEPSYALARQPTRDRLCVIDVGSRNVKLGVASVSPEDPRTLREDRVCRSRLQLGEKTFDQATQTQRPLTRENQQTLVALIAEYVAQCQRDGGRMLGAIATEWARRATNPDEIRDAVQAGAGVHLDILARERESRYGYLAATLGVPGKTVLDFGSRSVQLSFWPQGATRPEVLSVPMGIDEAGDRYFGKKEHAGYATARAAFVVALRAAMAPALKTIEAELKAGRLAPELVSLAENGDIALALEGKLWSGDPVRGVDEAGYGALLKTRQPTATGAHGLVTAMLPADDVAALGKKLEEDTALFEELRGDRLKRIYGYKMLAYPAIIALLSEAGVRTVVQVPQELSAGVVVDSVRR